MFVRHRKELIQIFSSIKLNIKRNMSTINKNKYIQRTDLPMLHLFDNSETNVYNPEIISLSNGAPGPDLLIKCCENFSIATEHRMKYEKENNCFLFQYGPQKGTHEFSTHMAKFLSNGYGDKVHPSDLVLTNGASGGLHLILSTLIDMNGIIFVDEVTYFIALECFALFTEMKIVTVPMTKNGVNVKELRKLIEKYKFGNSKKMFWGMYYTIPTFHNPTGILFSKDICKELIKISREEDILITCDDVYNLLNYNDDFPPPRLFAYDNMEDDNYKGNVISNGSFSKIISPGIRLGWMECPPRCVELFNNCGVLKSGGAINNYTSGILTSMIQLGLAQSQLKFYRDTYKERMKIMCDVLEKNLPSQCIFERPTGGYFVWIELPSNIDGKEFNDFCLNKYKIGVINGKRFSAVNSFNNYIRLTVGFHSSSVINDSVKILCDALKDYLKMNEK